MKKRLHDKKAGIAILISLIIISLAEIIFRAVAMGLEAVLTTVNFGEQLAVIALAVTILVLNAKGKDRACYICYGAWIAHFVIDKMFSLPARITFLFAPPENLGVTTLITQVSYIIGLLCIIGIGVMLVEYMNDGTICNKAFNTLCAVTIVLISICIVLPFYDVIFNNHDLKYALVGFNNLRQSVMVFLFAFFAYDSAKAQLKKVKFSK